MSDIIRRIDSSTGSITTVVGNATLGPTWSEDGFTQYAPASGDWGPPGAAYLGQQDMHMILAGTDMYIADTANYAIRKVINYHILR